MYPQLTDGRLAQLGYRKLLIKNYLAIYHVDEQNKTVTIMRFLYAASNYLKQLQGGEPAAEIIKVMPFPAQSWLF